MRENPNRRSFLKAAGVYAAAGAMAALPCPAAGGTDGKWQMRLSTSSIHFMGLPVEKACERISRLGFDAIDIWSAHAGCPHLDDVVERVGPDGLKRLLKKHNLELFSFSVYKGGYKRYAELLGKSGRGVAVRGSERGEPDSKDLVPRMKKFIDGLKPLVELAEKHDSYLAIENHGNALLCSLDSLKAFVDINDSPRLGIALAPYHIQTFGGSVPEAIRICGKQLFFFYAWQHHPGAKQLPGIGPTDMKPWLEALADIKYRGYVNPFMHGHPEPDVMESKLAEARDYLKDCYAEISEK